MQNACMHAAKLFYKTWKIQTSCTEKSNKICLHFVKFLHKLPATLKNFEKSFILLGFNLMFSGPEHRFLPLNLDWIPKRFSEKKCQQRKLKLTFEKETNNSLQMYLKIE